MTENQRFKICFEVSGEVPTMPNLYRLARHIEAESNMDVTSSKFEVMREDEVI